MLRAIKDGWIKGDKRKIAIIALEAMILLGMLAWAVFAPVKTLHIGCEDFVAAGIGDGVYDGSTITIRNAPAQRISVWGYHLKGGAYEVSVKYRAGIEGNRNFQDAAAVFDLETKWPIKFSQIELKDQHTTATGRLWVPMGADCRDLNASVWYRGRGELELESISITEKCIYRYVLVACAALVFLVLDLLYVFFFCGHTVMTEKKKAFLALSGITLAASIPFIADFIIEGHDLFFHLERIVLLGEELKYGQFPVRMFTTANNYYGYPTPIFYCDIFLYVSALLYNCMVPLQTCYQIYIFLINAATCAIAYYVFYRITAQRMLSVLGTALYVLCITRVNHLMIRAAVGEYSAMTFLPLVFLGMYEIYSKQKIESKDWLPLALGMAGVIHCHMITTELIAVDLVLFCLMLFFSTVKAKRIAAIVKAAGVCVLLIAWFIVPFLDYYLTHDIRIGNEVYALQDRGTYLIQLLGVFGTTGNIGANYYGQMGTHPLTIGFPLIVGVVMILVCLVNRQKWKVSEEKNHSVWICFFFIALLNLAMTMQFFPWDIIQMRLGTEPGQLGQFIGSIQFPWRWMTPAAAMLVFCTVSVLAIIQKKDARLYRYSCVVLMLSVAISVGQVYQQYSTQAFLFRTHDQPVDKYMDDLYLLSGTDMDAYRWSEAIVEEGDAQIESYHKEAGVSYLSVANHANEPAQVTLPIYGYRHYHAVDENGQELPIRMGKNDLVSFDVAPGYSGEITVRFVPPAYWRAAEIISLSTAFVLAVAAIWNRYRREKRIAEM